METPRWAMSLGMAFMLVGCSSATPPAETVTVTTERSVTTERPTTAAPSQTISAPPSTADVTPAPSAQSWTMPDLIGGNLQDAQDAIQALSTNEIFYSGSTDLTGRGRNQMLDRNWQVCTSTPPPGSTITTETMIDFGVVRIDSETCP